MTVADASSSSGLLLYAALVDRLAEDFLSEEANRVMKKKDKISAFMFVLAGGENIFRPSTTNSALTFA